MTHTEAIDARVPRGRRAQTRRRLLEAAAQTFSRRGYEGATFREIAATAQLSRGLLTFHFGNKRGLELAVAEWVHERWVERLAAVYQNRVGSTVVDRLIEAHADLTLGERENARLLCRLRLDPSRDAAPLRQRMLRIDEAVDHATRVVLAELTGTTADSAPPESGGRGQWVVSALHGIELRAAAGESDERLLSAYQALRDDLLTLLRATTAKRD
ncbi:MAG: TetR/AcrR family transcriptional regulator [Myxococcota bacterium]|jgi:AcrR family transcriptional regulator